MFRHASAITALVLFAPLLVGCNNSKPMEDEAAVATETNVAAASGEAAEPNGPPKVGDTAPAWAKLVGTDDKEHSLKDLDDVEAVAVVFTCNHCPVAKAYEDRLVQLAKDYKDKSFQLVAINVNNLEEDKLPAMKERAEEKGFDFPYLYDPSQAIGRAFGAMVTPHAFLLNADREIVYMGAIDDSQAEDKVEHYYLRNAIDAVLAGEEPETSTTKQFGCGIKYE